MCGIAGIVRWDGRPASSRTVQAMCDSMIHRGPDDQGIYLDDSAALGMRRLSIIDLATGHQPVSNEDGTVWVVFNGEIYNFKELRRDLLRRGHQFHTTTDTEVIVHLYEEVGPHAVDLLRGMFTFAIWDAKRRQLFIARDRVGIKPLYYAQLDGALVFASELKCMLQVPEIERRLSWPAVNHLFTFLATPASQSIIAGVQKLEPGHRASLSRDGRFRIERYWDVQFDPDTRSTEAEMAERLGELLTESVDLHLRSDVPLGAFLSGGIDSSAVVGTMSRLLEGRVKTFSIGFQDAAYDELAWARQAAAHFGTDHAELILEPQHLDITEDIAWYLDEPFGDSSAIPTYVVSKMAAEHVKVVLTGDGGDELFAGYDKYLVEQRERQLDQVPGAVRHALAAIGRAMPEGMKGRNFLRHLALDGPRRYLDSSTLFDRSEQARLFRPEVHEQIAAHDPWADALRHLAVGDDSWLSSLQYFDLQCYLPLDILTKVDRMSMAASIESRPALLDHRLIEFAATVPAEMRMRGGTTKYLFKRAMRGLVPDAIIDRPKQGFAIPLSKWFRGNWSGFVEDLLLSERCRQRGIFDPAYLSQLIRLNASGRNLDLHLWTIVSFEQWCRTFLDRRPTRPERELPRPVNAVAATSAA
jgi:asparagine synthase (glutamine-hydrolysing)